MNALLIQLVMSVPAAVILIILLLLVAGLIGYLTAWYYAKSVYTPVIKKLEDEKVQLNREIDRLRDEISKLKIEMEKSNKKISNPQFMEKAPKDIIGKETEKFKQSSHSLKILYDQLEKMQEIKK